MSRHAPEMSRAMPPENQGVADVPRYLMEDKAGRAWLAVYDPSSPTRSWDSADVDVALKEAFTLLRRLGGRLGPRGDAGFWPAICRGLDGLDNGETERGSRRVAPGAVTRMEQVLDWLRATPGSYLTPDTSERNALMLWCWCIERNQKWATVLAEIGAKKATQDRYRRRASLYIAAGLCRDDVRIPRSILIARLERARADVREDPLDELADAALHEPDQPVVPTVPTAREVSGWPIPVFWEEIEKAQAVEDANARANAVVAIIFERVLAEHGGSNTDDALRAADRRRNQLVSEAVRRGLLDRAAARACQLSKDELSERVRILRGEP